MKSKMKLAISSLLCMGAAASVQAYDAGDMIVRFGAVTVAPNESSSTPRLNYAASVPGDVRVDNNMQVGLNATYMIDKNWGVELLAATPFKHEITASSTLQKSLGLADNKLGTTEHLPPTLTVQYYFDTGSDFTPYVGAGLNYTTFFHEKVNSNVERNFGRSHMSLSSSWGLALEAGFDYKVADNWAINAAVWRVDIDTTAHIDTAAAGRVSTNVSIDPWVYMVGAAYKF